MMLVLWYPDGISKKFYRPHKIAIINKKSKEKYKNWILILNKQHYTTIKDVCNGDLTT